MNESENLLKRVKSVRLSDTVADQILELIAQGALNVGDRLPGERELVKQLDVGRASVREALRILEARGFLAVRPGKGAFVVGKPGEISEESLRGWFQQNATKVFDMMDVRSALERKAAFLAGSNATSEHIEQMRRTLDQADALEKEGDLDRLGALDHQFHHLLGSASGNPLLTQLVDSTIEALIAPRRSIQGLPGRAQKSIKEHRAILKALIKRDPAGAERAVAGHIASVREAVLGLVELEQRAAKD